MKPTAGGGGGRRGGERAFKPVDWDDTPPPSTPDGQWTVRVASTKVETTDDGYPRVIIEYKLLKTDNDEHEQFINQTVSDRITFAPPGKYQSNMIERINKLSFRQLCELLDIDTDVVPKKIRSAASLGPFLKALKAAGKFEITTVTNAKGFTNVRYESAEEEGLSDEEDEEDDDEEEEGDDDEEENDEEGDDDEDSDEDDGEGDEDDGGDEEDEEEEEDEKPARKKKTAKKRKAA